MPKPAKKNFRYSPEQRAEICGELFKRPNDDIDEANADGVVETLEAITGGYIKALADVDREVSEDDRALLKNLRETFCRKPGKSKGRIQMILDALDAEAISRNAQFWPHLKQELGAFEAFLEQNKQGRSRPRNPAIFYQKIAISELADIWFRVRGKQPGRTTDHYSDEKTGGPFVRFVRSCMKPTGTELSDTTIRDAIENWQSEA